jgi:adenosylcobinamide-phosphate synthase
MDFLPLWYSLPAAFLLDLIIGDPTWLPHPIRWMGRVIVELEPRFRKLPMHDVPSGLLFAATLIFCTWAVTGLLLYTAHLVHPAVSVILEIILIYFAISVRSLETSAMPVYRALKQKQVEAARKRVSQIIGRDVERLTETGIASGAVESVAENLVDGVVSPMVYACIGGAPLAMAFKMVNTLDSMIGYKNETYRSFGKAAARIDDIANYIPARLSVIFIAIAAKILCGEEQRAFRTALNEGSNHTSPNAGYSEASFAGALGIKLNGPCYYGKRLVAKPFIGIRYERPTVDDIKRACDLMILSALISFIVLWGSSLLIEALY